MADLSSKFFAYMFDGAGGYKHEVLDGAAFQRNKHPFRRFEGAKALESATRWCRLGYSTTIGCGVIADTDENDRIMKVHAWHEQNGNDFTQLDSSRAACLANRRAGRLALLTLFADKR